MRHGGKQRGTDHAGDASVRLLQARVELFKAAALAIEKAVQAGAFSGKMRFNFRLHRLRIGPCKHGLAGEVEGVHGIKLPELQIVIRASPSLGEEFVKKELHHKKGGTEIEAVLAESDFCAAPADNILLFK